LTTSPLTLVLDTNIVIDWLVFDDAGLQPLHEGVRTGRIALLTHQPAIDELHHVLGYPQLRLDAARQTILFADYLAQTSTASAADPLPPERWLLPAKFPRCRDPDDQHFLTLAYRSGAHALVSRDNAVLKLKKRAARFGVTILNVHELIALLGSLEASQQSFMARPTA
jgi:putative PIN family toxin of toxin-antitoxin system